MKESTVEVEKETTVEKSTLDPNSAAETGLEAKDVSNSQDLIQLDDSFDDSMEEPQGQRRGDRSLGLWLRLGRASVDSAYLDHDTMFVSGRRLTAIQLRVSNSPMILQRMTITFENGQTFTPSVRGYFRANSSSGVIDLPGNVRNIRRVDFWYRDLAGGGRASVELLGRQARIAR